MEISHPTAKTFWIATAGATPVAGATEPTQTTSFGPMWTLLLQTTDEAEWQAECGRLGIELEPPLE